MPVKAKWLNADMLDGNTASDFATATHEHAAYSATTHEHDAAYAALAHEHDGAITLGGDASNHVAIAADGTLSLVGTARAWDDLRIEPVARSTGANAPTFEVYLTNGAGSRGVWLYSFDNAAGGSEKEIFFSVQMPHQWAATAINMHVHWIAATSAATSKVRWALEYTWAEPTTVFGNTTIVYADTTIDAKTATTAFNHEITSFASLTPSSAQNGLSSTLICRMYRDSANAADTYGDKVGMLYVDAHYELDKLGSNTEYA